jgi:ferrous iron transport protein B
MKLSDLRNNESGIITRVKGRGPFRKRITEMGFVAGKKVTAIKNAPLNDPIEYSLLGYNLSLRRVEAALIEVMPADDAGQIPVNDFNGVINRDLVKTGEKTNTKVIHVALVGNPNSGKTSIFNFASNSKEKVGNYSGVTVNLKTATFKYDGYVFHITDLPGTYSISAYSPEEVYVREFIIHNRPDVVVNIIDASNLERNLYLTTELIDMNIKTVIALNMYDELLKSKDDFNFSSLGKMIGIPIVPTVGSKGRGIKELFSKVIHVFNDKDPYIRSVNINYGYEIERSIKKIEEKVSVIPVGTLPENLSSRFLAIKLLEKDITVMDFLLGASNYKEIKEVVRLEVDRLEKEYGSDSETVITDTKYGFIGGALKETFKPGSVSKRKITETIDSFLTNRLFGFPVFLFFIWIMFTATFTLGKYPMNWIQGGVSWIENVMSNTIAEGSFKDLLIEGIIGGVGGVIIFLPNILILFFFISLMEDTGYMARAAFITDKLMHKIGLHGKSFIPLIMGFGCNVPAIMATRTIESRNNRLLTMLITPLMSCSAQLPVYILIIGAFFPAYQGTILFLVYFTGILLAVLLALFLKKFFFRSQEVPFVMELPPYRIPTFRSTTKHMWHKGSQYLKKMGGIILVASIIIWSLGHYPLKVDYSKNYDTEIAGINKSSIPDTEKERLVHSLEVQKKAEHQEKSYIGRIGKFIEPAIKPLGFDWKIGICLVSGVAAKEIVVSTMGVIYHADDDEKLTDKLKYATYTSGSNAGKKIYNPLVAVSLLLFTLIYFPCIAVIVVINRESGSLRWALFVAFYSTLLAWMVSFMVYQAGSVFLKF